MPNRDVKILSNASMSAAFELFVCGFPESGEDAVVFKLDLFETGVRGCSPIVRITLKEII